ncbi:MAG: amino acid adenylation domain-containing protein, partial [bacterium]|nr:amino acid adenylation domain-containing protein [bacterium]
QDYQFEDLVETVVTQRDLSRNALFDVMLNLQNMDGRVLAIPGLTLSPYQYETVTSKFDLILTVILENTGDFFFSLNYSTTLFKQETIERFIDYFKRLTGRLTENKQQRLSQVELLSDEERRRILEDFNNTQVDYPSDQTIHQLFEEQVLQTGDCPALIGSKQITYRELDKKSNQLAGRLNREGIAVGTIIAIIATRSVEMLVGILAILKAGGAYLPINPDYPPGRIQYMLEDTNTPLMLTHSLSAGNDLSAAVGIPFIPLAHPSSYTGSSDSPGHPDTPSAPAYVMYTSGSTGKPKGVLVEHRNVNRLVINTDYVRFTPETRILQTGAPVFDATTFEMWGALLNGGQLALVEQETILDAHRLGRAIQEFRVNTLWLSSALFNQLFHDNPDMFLPLNYLLVGGDVLSPPHINALRKKCKSLKIINGYGPTENTTFSTTFLINRDYRDSIPIGSPISNSTAYILNNSACLQPVGIVGELCVGGDGVAVGYLNNPEATAEKFIRYAPLKGKRLYRTGDFVRWMPDGNIEFQGRVDNQIKIRGFRVETAEIESELLQHGHIREAVIIPKEHEDGSKYLCAYIVAGDEIPVSQLRDYLQDRLPGYMIPTYIMQLEQMPLTPNGKIDRKALPDPERQEAHRYIAPGNEMEEKMAEIWSEILGLSSDRIGINDDFFQSGGHSLKAVGLLARVHKDFSVQIPIPDLFSNPTISGICRLIAKSGASVYHAVQPVEEREYYPLSSAQKRLFVLQQMDKESVGYNLPMIWQVAGNIDGGKIEEVFQRLVQRHESLRTSFYVVKENAVQRVHPEKKFEMNDVNPEGPMEDFIRPFDLSNAPLLRVGLMKKGDRSHLMLMDMHHIISDGASMQVFINDFTTLYAGKHLPLPRLQYKDFSQWQNSPGQEEAIKKQEVYWLKQFGGDLPILNLPTDYPRPASHRFEGETSRIKLGEAESVAIIQLTRQWGASLYMVLLAVYTVFLSRISGREDVIVGTPMAGRSREELQGIIGMFVNTHGIRNIAESGKTFDHFIEDVKENTLEALENQDYPFDQLVNKVLVNRETGHNPLFDVLFTFRDKENTTLDIPGLTLKPYPYDRGVTKFDLTLSAEECPDGLKLTFEYSTRLFKAETLERFSAYFIEIICSVLENPHRQLGTIEMKPQSEKQALLDAIQQSDKGYPPAKTITELFEDQVKRTPDHIAIVGHFVDEKVDEHNLGYHLRHLTYSQLNQAGGHLARQLVEKGVQPNNIVGIQLERCIQMMTGILGILKSGATYLPMNPKQPPQRTRFMMADTGAVMLLTGAEILRLSAGAAPGGSEYGHISTTVQSVAYIIYTSGSTGNPKGVPITHANFSPLLHWTYHEYGIDTRHRALKNLSFFFDWCVWEIFVILTTGASLYTIDADLLSNAGLMLELMRRYDITWLNITPTQYRYLLDEEQSQETLRVLNLGAEKLSLELTGAALGRVAENCRVFNLYGPTETTILTAFMEITPGNFDNFTDLSSVPIGWPTGNTVLLVLDQHFRPCPIGVQGELYIAGDALANGYLNNKELTGEKFILIPTPRWGLGLNTELRCYKTGDLVRRLPDGVIEYIGRTDHQVKIRGFRIEPGEIKISLEKNKVVKEALVMARENQRNERYLCAYIIPAAGHTGTPDIVAELKDYLSSQLPAYMVPAVFLTLDKMPLNPNRKVDLKALPEPRFNEKDTHHISPRNGIERQIARIWADTLQLEEDNIGIDSDFFYLGGHSMSATVAIGKIHHECGVRIPLARFFVMTTIRKLAKHIQSSGDRVFQSIPELEKAQYYEISSGQKRLYLLQQPDPASIDYNMTNAFVFEGDLDRERFETTCRDLIRRHEGLRTFFRQADGRIVQCILEHAPFQVKYSNARHESQINDHIKRFIAPFDLSRAPLFRVEVIALNEKKHVVMFDMHHIVSDGNSMDLLSHDFFHLYVGGNTGLVPLTVQYKDYAHWRNNTLSGENLKKQDDYWMEKLRGFSFTQLPIDNIGGYQQVLGKKEVLNIEAPLYDKIKTFCNEMNVTGFAFMLTAFNIALFAETEQSDLTIGIPVSQRNHPDLKNLVGMFLNVLLIRSVIDNENTFDDFLMQNKQTAIDALNHQHYPYEILSTRMTEHSPSRSKDLFSILFNYINTPTDNTLTAGDFSIQPYENSEAAPKYDITLYVYDTGNAITLSAVYKGNLYEESTVRNLLEALYLVINDVFVSGNVEISALIADMYSYRYQGEEGFDNEFEQYYDEYED